jgi:hypothetical protein
MKGPLHYRLEWEQFDYTDYNDLLEPLLARSALKAFRIIKIEWGSEGRVVGRSGINLTQAYLWYDLLTPSNQDPIRHYSLEGQARFFDL